MWSNLRFLRICQFAYRINVSTDKSVNQISRKSIRVCWRSATLTGLLNMASPRSSGSGGSLIDWNAVPNGCSSAGSGRAGVDSSIISSVRRFVGTESRRLHRLMAKIGPRPPDFNARDASLRAMNPSIPSIFSGTGLQFAGELRPYLAQ